MGFVESFKHNLVKPFEGRASRSEYWWFVLWYVILFFVPYMLLLGMIGGFAASAPNGELSPGMANFLAGGSLVLMPVLFAWIFLVYWMGVALLCTGMRRLHDTDRSAWWALIGIIPLIGWIILLVFYCLPGTAGTNRFGDDPLQPVDATVFR